MRSNTAIATLATTALALSLAACSGGDDASGDDVVRLGVSLPMTGVLGATGATQEAGYQLAVDAINDAGGLEVGDETLEVELVVKDNRSDANLAGQQARELVLKDHVDGLLSGCTPAITVPVVQVAEVQKVPMMTTCNPVGVFGTFSDTGLEYTWDMFFAETDQAAYVFKTFDQVETSKRVALFTDTEPDGVAQRQLFTAAAEQAGYEIVGDYSFAVGTTDFSSFINDAKSKGADLVISQTIIPDGIALYKQIKALGLAPAAALAAKAGSTSAWPEALGGAADGTLTTAYWVPGGPLTEELQAGLTDQLPAVPDQGIAVSSFAAAQVLLEAFTSAGSTEAAKVNDAIAATDLETPVGRVTFDEETHTFATPLYVLQWSGSDAEQVYPDGDGAKPLAAPVAGLS